VANTTPAVSGSRSWCACSAVAAICDRARVRRDFWVLTSPWERSDRQLAALADGSPKSTCSPRLLGTDAGAEAQGDVGMHAGACRGRQQGGSRVQGQAVAGPPGLPLECVHKGGDVPADQAGCLGVPDDPGHRVVPMATATVEYRRATTVDA